MNFIILYRGQTTRNGSYYKLLVEYETGLWREATYFGNTVPKRITSIFLRNDNWIVEIQPHTSRDKATGRFKCSRRVPKELKI